MKRAGHLFDQLVSWPNLLLAARRARRGKRFLPNVARFEYELEYQLLDLQRRLRDETYRPGPYRTFVIHEPKRRTISAAPYHDRVVHHALCNVIEPIFEPTFIDDTYACRKGKGNHAAANRAAQFARCFRYVLQADVQKFFPSVDHQILLRLVERKIKDACVLRLVRRIVAHSGPQERPIHWFPGDDLFTPLERPCGLPIGNQTSQFLANVMLNPLDHFVKEQLRIPGYVRYSDDLLLFDDDKAKLATARSEVQRFLQTHRLRLHPRKSVVYPVTQGMPFLGYRIFPTHRLLDKRHLHRFRRRLRALQRGFAAGRIGADAIGVRIVSWMGHARHACTYHLVRRLLRDHPFVRPRSAESRK